ncbi:hypothetical protein P7H15_13035 [Paenibacillus larvae]|nr:hypothetical protein [Paenibacillus larvae]MDT2293576.1 hypothetical protein [Paenibacillus larvae]
MPMRWNTNFPIDLLFDQLREENQTADTSLYSTVVMLENIHDKRYLDAVAYRMLFHFVREDTGIRGTVHFDPDRYTGAAWSSESSVTLPICSDKALAGGSWT